MSSASFSYLTRPLFGWAVTLVLLLLGCWLMAVCWHEWLSESVVASSFDCESGRRWLIRQLGGRLLTPDDTGIQARVPFENVLGCQVAFTLLWWLGGAAILSWRRRSPFVPCLLVWGGYSAAWWLLAGSWTIVRLLATICGATSAVTVISHCPELWLSFASSGWMTSFICLALHRPTPIPPSNSSAQGIPWPVWSAILLFTVVYGTLNHLLYLNLLVPHGDSAMYEEHLWNLLHGKGFRSFIDKGLFLGEHIQMIHLGLIPIYLLWPSHIILEWCQSWGLALGAIPVYQMARRQTQSRLQSGCLACAYLFYVPMQRLDVSIDFKTFRPEAFGIPILLAALNALDDKKWRSFGCWLMASLLVKEDYALIIGPLGLWMAVTAWFTTLPNGSRWRNSWPGLLLSVAAALYLIWAVKVVIPYFKGGDQVHYAKYFSKFGETTNEILINLLTQPGLLGGELATPVNFLFGASLVCSLALLPLFAPGRLAVGLPLLGRSV